MTEKYNSIYLGICIQNNDPDHRGRIKVWVPHVSTNVYNKWNQLKQDTTFSFPGSPDGEKLSSILGELRNDLPWAEPASPVMGASTAGYYNAPTDTNSVSDAPLAYSLPGTNYPKATLGTPVDKENKGGKPGAFYETNPVSDAFGNTAKINSNHLNPKSNVYKPATYSNSAKGIFSIPNVGSHIWVFFREGMPMYPVYFGAAFGKQDFESIFKSGDNSFPDYPGTYENKTTKESTDSAIYKNKMVLNQRGAAIEIINTTDKESYKVTHFAGGFYELNNYFTAQFNPKNFQLLTQADKFETIRGFNNLFVGRDFDQIVREDYYIKVGNFNVDAAAKWADLYNKISSNTDPASLTTALQSLSADLTAQEKQSGNGGNMFEFITKHKIITVGLQENTSPAYRFDETLILVPGLDVITGIAADLALGYFTPTVTTFPQYEKLLVSDMPGGNLDIFAMNRFKVQAGTGGLSLNTTGNALLNAGGILDIAGSQVNINSSQGQISINGSLVTINADVLSLKSNIPDNQVVVDSSLGVSKNVIIGGGAYVEGELLVNHITAPIEYQVTENTQIVATGVPILGAPGKPASGWSISRGLTQGTLNVTVQEGSLGATGNTAVLSINLGSIIDMLGGVLTIAQPHSHVFKNVPLTLLNQEPGPNDFNKYATDTLKNSKAAGSSTRLDGRNPAIGVPPPSLYSVDGSGSPFNYPNGPGSSTAGPNIVPSTAAISPTAFDTVFTSTPLA